MSNYADRLFSALSADVQQRKQHQSEVGRPIDADILDVLSVDLNIPENAKLHHTNEYEMCRSPPYRLVIRRGHQFLVTLHCNRPYQHDRDAILLEFCFGQKPTLESFTKRLMEVKQPEDKLVWQWGTKVEKLEENQVRVVVKCAANCPVGEWTFGLHTGRRNYSQVSDTYPSLSVPSFIFILFNPWCSDDPVYLDDEEWCNEYVLRDHGAIWEGAKYKQYSPMAWNFGQFEDVALFAALVCLRQGRYMGDEDRADPITVARKLTLAINDNVVAGNWTGPYGDGTKPWQWTGSTAILEQYMTDPNQRVKYGQLCRALGIPCRSVTNIRSAHDTDQTLTIDRVYMKNQSSDMFEEVKLTSDSVWNFHVWNELWCRRTDLPPGYDGWQVHDATPQEMSQGRYQCGPMSVAALRKGEVRHNFDGWFIYGEVNADVVRWYFTSDPSSPEGKRLVKAYNDTTDIGRAIITSRRGDPMKYEDITASYKAEEGSDEERSQIRRAVRAAVAKEREEILELFKCKQLQDDDVLFQQADIDEVEFGMPVSSWLLVRNKGKTKRSLKIHMELFILSYTGVAQKSIASKSISIELNPSASETLMLEANGTKYGYLLQENSQMCVDAMATVQETEQVFSQRDIFLVRKPGLYIEGDKSAEVNLPTTVTIRFYNTINERLTNCSLVLEGCGLHSNQLPIKCSKEVPGMGTLQVRHSVVPRKPGNRFLLAVFNCDQLANIRGTHTFQVAE